MKVSFSNKLLNIIVGYLFILLLCWAIINIENIPEKWKIWIGSIFSLILLFNALQQFYYYIKHSARVNADSSWIKNHPSYSKFIAEDQSRTHLYKEDMIEKFQQWMKQE